MITENFDKQERRRERLGSADIRVGIIEAVSVTDIPHKILSGISPVVGLLADWLFGSFCRVNVRVQDENGAWILYTQVPVANTRQSSGLFTSFGGTQPRTGDLCIVAFLGRGHTAANCVVIAFFNPKATADTVKTDEVKQSTAGGELVR